VYFDCVVLVENKRAIIAIPINSKKFVEMHNFIKTITHYDF